jgi:hypothetical protein
VKQEPSGEVVEDRSSEIRTNTGSILKEWFCVSVVAKWCWSVRTITSEISNTLHLQALNNCVMKLCIVRNISIAWVPVCRSPPNVNRRSNLTPYRRPILTPLIDGFWR